MATRVYWALVNRALGTDNVFEPGALARFYETGTTTPVTVYSDAALSVAFSQPVEADEDGLFPEVYYGSTTPLRVLITDADGAPLPGYPLDNVIPTGTDVTGADGIPFTPTEALPYSTVQDAIVGAASLATDQTTTQDRALTPWVTAGSSNAYTITPDPAILGYGTFQAFRVRFDRANTGAATLNVNGLGARNIYKTSRTGTPGALVSGDLQPGDIYDLTYDGTQFIVVGAVTAQGTGWRKDRTGLYLCWTRATFEYINASAIGYTWTFPGGAFAETPSVSVTRPSGPAGTYTDLTERTSLMPIQGAGATAPTIYLVTPAGAPALVATASITNVSLFAIGRWF